MSFAFNLGDVVQDTITGFQGAIVARTEWHNGCLRYLVQPQELKDHRPIEPEWLDEAQIRLVASSEQKPSQEKRGGPQKKESKSPV